MRWWYLLACLVGCGAGTPTPLEQSEIIDYGSSQLVCGQVASTRAAAESCIGAVKAYWCGPHGPLHDAGACTYTPPASAPVDGGRE